VATLASGTMETVWGWKRTTPVLTARCTSWATSLMISEGRGEVGG
jgi:hypothetical protein